MTPTTHVSLVMLIWFQELLNNIPKEVNFHHQLVEDHGTSTTKVTAVTTAACKAQFMILGTLTKKTIIVAMECSLRSLQWHRNFAARKEIAKEVVSLALDTPNLTRRRHHGSKQQVLLLATAPTTEHWVTTAVQQYKIFIENVLKPSVVVSNSIPSFFDFWEVEHFPATPR
jgi:hypothetical protein